jgi:hypothetical protein
MSHIESHRLFESRVQCRMIELTNHARQVLALAIGVAIDKERHAIESLSQEVPARELTDEKLGMPDALRVLRFSTEMQLLLRRGLSRVCSYPC